MSLQYLVMDPPLSCVITVSHDGCTVTLMSLEYLMVVPLLQ